jgi:hypothetical protein
VSEAAADGRLWTPDGDEAVLSTRTSVYSVHSDTSWVAFHSLDVFIKKKEEAFQTVGQKSDAVTESSIIIRSTVRYFVITRKLGVYGLAR